MYRTVGAVGSYGTCIRYFIQSGHCVRGPKTQAGGVLVKFYDLSIRILFYVLVLDLISEEVPTPDHAYSLDLP